LSRATKMIRHYPVTTAALTTAVTHLLSAGSINVVYSFTRSRTIATYTNIQRTRSTFFVGAPSSSSIFTRRSLFPFPDTSTTKVGMSSSMISSSYSSSSPEISISEAFDGGNGQLFKTDVDDNGETTVYVNIRKDPYTELEKVNHSQYFSFRATVSSVVEPNMVKYILANAGSASYACAWEDSTTFVSTTPFDPHSWTRKLDTTYDSDTGHLSWTHNHKQNESVYFSYFPPYSYERHLNLLAKVSAAAVAPSPTTDIAIESLGQTLDGREMDCIKVGRGKSICWIIHRQHPGEPMAEFYAEGLLDRLLGLSTGGSVDGMVRRVTAEDMYTFYIVPCMCPDGAFRGHLRTNAKGQNLNREWAPSGGDTPSDPDYYNAPTLERSPEVYHILRKMDQTGCDVFLDVHGDEELPFNFLAGSEGCPNWSPRLQHLHGAFLASYARINSDMQIPISYEPEEMGKGRTNVCSNQIAMRYDCLASTLEMPFKDCLSNKDPVRGWNPARSMQLGASVLGALAYVQPFLRSEGNFWENAFRVEDRYVRPKEDYKS